MRLRPELSFGRSCRLLAAAGSCLLFAACSGGGGGLTDFEAATSTADVAYTAAGAQADYPVTLGAPFVVDGTLYTPNDAVNYDEIGYATLDPSGSTAVSIAHRTLPIPSYVELTALDSGKTILARVERRGPMHGPYIAGLSRGAAMQLRANEGTPIRARRVLPPESERAQLRKGAPASARADMPLSLVNVLRRKLPVNGSADIAMPTNRARQDSIPTTPTTDAMGEAATRSFDRAFGGTRTADTRYPLSPLNGVAARATLPAPAVAVATPERATTNSIPPGEFVVQAAAFSNEANATRAAKAVGGFIEPAGRFYRVRLGPFADRKQAEAALAKARNAGYGSARVFTTG